MTESHKRTTLFGAKIDVLSMQQAVSQLQDWVIEADRCAPDPTPCRYVVTPNVDHAVMLQESDGLRRAYADADLVLADGWPVVLASRLLRRPLPGRVAGSDLVPCLFKHATEERPLTVFLLGAGPGVAQRAAKNIHARWPHVKVVQSYSPPMGFQDDEVENERILEMISGVSPDVLVVGLGAPKQELWVNRFHARIDASVALCVGATIDFLAGEKNRAPRWIRRIGMEWMHRMLSEPKRLGKRYARDAWVFPRLVLREWWQRPC